MPAITKGKALQKDHQRDKRHRSKLNAVGVRAQQRRNLRENTRYDRKVAKLTQPRPNGFGN